MSHFDSIAGRLHGDSPHRRTSSSPCSKIARAGSTACSSIPRWLTRRAARRCSGASSSTCVAAGRLDDGLHRRHAGRRPCAARSATAGPSAGLGGGLGGRGRAGASGHRAPAHLCLRRHRPHAPGRVRAGRRDVPAAHGHRAHPCRRRRAVLRAAAGHHRAEEKRKIIGEQFVRIFEETHGRPHRCRVPGAGHAPTSSRAVPRPRLRHQEPPQRRRASGGRPSSSSSRCGTCSRTRSAASA